EFAAPRVKKVIEEDKILRIEFQSDFGRFEFDEKKYSINKKGFDLCCDTDDCFKDDNMNWFVLKDFQVLNDSVLLEKPSGCIKSKYVRYLWRHKPCEYKMCPLYSKTSNLPVTPFLSQVNSSENRGMRYRKCSILVNYFSKTEQKIKRGITNANID
ncbi:unnamed protein product, partial [Brachionus calyciflorus]